MIYTVIFLILLIIVVAILNIFTNAELKKQGVTATAKVLFIYKNEGTRMGVFEWQTESGMVTANLGVKTDVFSRLEYDFPNCAAEVKNNIWLNNLGEVKAYKDWLALIPADFEYPTVEILYSEKNPTKICKILG
ncbi:MAG: hypothetical protein LBL93_05315 [Ruminococcus sp.]|jgi:hypothetical protein|nr:hypothetical protein [Ruminococcus sp.]